MKVFDLSFSDGKRCRCIIPEPEPDDVELASLRGMFGNDRLESMHRIVAPPPGRLPWKRDGDMWRIHSFKLQKLESGLFRCTWPGGSIEGDKDVISSAVREHWAEGV